MVKVRETSVPQILVEVKAPSGSGDLTRKAFAPEDFGRRADEVAESLAVVADRFQEHLEEAADIQRPRKAWVLEDVQVRFALDLQAEAGVIIARTSASATFEVALTWKARGGGP
jgi:indole-3-glycerol phosphate synthase